MITKEVLESKKQEIQKQFENVKSQMEKAQNVVNESAKQLEQLRGAFALLEQLEQISDSTTVADLMTQLERTIELEKQINPGSDNVP